MAYFQYHEKKIFYTEIWAGKASSFPAWKYGVVQNVHLSASDVSIGVPGYSNGFSGEWQLGEDGGMASCAVGRLGTAGSGLDTPP